MSLPSELENEGVRSILAKLEAIDARLKKAEAHLEGIAAGDVCWRYTAGRVYGPGILAGQDFANTIRGVATDIKAIFDALPTTQRPAFLGPYTTDWAARR